MLSRHDHLILDLRTNPDFFQIKHLTVEYLVLIKKKKEKNQPPSTTFPIVGGFV